VTDKQFNPEDIYPQPTAPQRDGSESRLDDLGSGASPDSAKSAKPGRAGQSAKPGANPPAEKPRSVASVVINQPKIPDRLKGVRGYLLFWVVLAGAVAAGLTWTLLKQANFHRLDWLSVPLLIAWLTCMAFVVLVLLRRREAVTVAYLLAGMLMAVAVMPFVLSPWLLVALINPLAWRGLIPILMPGLVGYSLARYFRESLRVRATLTKPDKHIISQ
jgi:hypothetical protein